MNLDSLLNNGFILSVFKKLRKEQDDKIDDLFRRLGNLEETAVVRGPAGQKGNKGNKGDFGPRGFIGETGEKGPIGPIGPRGLPADITPVKKMMEEFTDETEKSVESLKNTLSTQVGDNKEYIEKFSKEFEERMEKTMSEYKAFVNMQIAKGMTGGPGGGSVNILQMDDVKFEKRHEVEGDAILIFDAVTQKFQSESFNDIIERLQIGMEKQYDRLVDTEGDFIYIGEAEPGTARDAATWRIKRVYEIGDDVEIIWADNTADFVKTWDDRATYEYN
jgi:hypothetical protein